MADKTTKPDAKLPKAKGEVPGGEPITPIFLAEEEHNTEKELHAHNHGSQNLEQNHRAEQQLKNQQQAQNNRENFPKGLAQEHGKGGG